MICLRHSIFVFALFSINQAFGQCSPCNDPAPVGIIDFNSARISVLAGSSVEFNFQTIDDYKNGISKTNSTVMGISVCNCNSEGGTSLDPVGGSTITGYSIYFDTDDAQFTGLSPSNSLPLCALEALANTSSGFAASAVTISNTKVALGQIPTVGGAIFKEDNGVNVITDRFWTTDQISIDYFMGVAPGIGGCTLAVPFIDAAGGYVPDSYYVTVSFTLVPECTTCTDVSS
jgi:hypothetical protein